MHYIWIAIDGSASLRPTTTPDGPRLDLVCDEYSSSDPVQRIDKREAQELVIALTDWLARA